MAESKAIEISKEFNRDIILGQVVQAVNGFAVTLKENCDKNSADHDKIFKRLDEGDQYFAVFKFSRCAFTWLDKQGALKWLCMMIVFFGLGWLSRYL